MGSDKIIFPEAYSTEIPPINVHVSTFYLGQYPVTQELWTAFMGKESKPFCFSGKKRPVEQVTWNEIQIFLEKISAATGHYFRLPAESEWEFAARGGIYSLSMIETGVKMKHSGGNRLSELGWYAKNSHGETKPVGLKFPNELGLYDMNGNVWEWCEDNWRPHYSGLIADGQPWCDANKKNRERVRRGGSYHSRRQQVCRVSCRGNGHMDGKLPFIGFRLALSLPNNI